MKSAMNVVVVITMWIALVTLALLALSRVCFAQDDKTALALVRCLVAECDRCDRSADEIAGIAWVLKKRMHTYNLNHRNTKAISFYEQVISYCAVFDKRSRFYYGNRSEKIRKSTLARTMHLSLATWKRLYEFATRFLSAGSNIVDPYPSANHFGGVLDIESATKRGCEIVGQHCNKWGHWCNYFLRCSDYRGIHELKNKR